MTMPTRVSLMDVGPRDGLQNEKQTIATRITSYNVCYTKLLRFVHGDEQLFDPHFAAALVDGEREVPGADAAAAARRRVVV